MDLWPAEHPALVGLDANNVPFLEMYRPPEGVKPVPVIMLVCPGGGYGRLSIEEEGRTVARWYAEQGITGVLLKYRLPNKGKWSPKKKYSTLGDGRRAVQLMRHKAQELGLPDARVGILGFSAGGHLACMTATRFDSGVPDAEDPVMRYSSRPDFACLIYPVVSFQGNTSTKGTCPNLLGSESTEEERRTYSGELNVTSNTPPMFMVHASNDHVKPENSLNMYLALRAQGIPAELHIVSRGGHGLYDKKGWGIPRDKDLRFSRSGGMWPVWSLNWLLEEELVPNPDEWIWMTRRNAAKEVFDAHDR